jgi:L-asparagine transporter-like permease
MKTLQDLRGKYWYRALQVLYFAIITISICVGLNNTGLEGWAYVEQLDTLVQIVVVLEIIKRVIYYVCFGHINPKRS